MPIPLREHCQSRAFLFPILAACSGIHTSLTLPAIAVPYWRIGADSDDEYGDGLYRNMLCNNEYFHRNLEGPVFKDCITTIPVAFLAWMELLVSGSKRQNVFFTEQYI